MKPAVILTFLFFAAISAVSLQYTLANKRYPDLTVNPDCPWCEQTKSENELLYLPLRSFHLRLICPSDPDFLSGLIWLRTTYYYGAHAVTDDEYEYLFELLDMVTDLSPKWEFPYVFGAIILPMDTEEFDGAVYLIDKGLKHRPEHWNLWFFKGYIYWKFKNDPETASKLFFRASQLPGAPKFLTPLSSTIALEAGNKQMAIQYLKTALKTLNDAAQIKVLLNKLEEITIVD